VPGGAGWDRAAATAAAEWLAGRAVALAHADVAEAAREAGAGVARAMGAALDRESEADGRAATATADPFPDMGDPEVVAAAEALASAVRARADALPPTVTPSQRTAAALAAAASAVESALLPAAVALGWDPASGTLPPPPPPDPAAAAAAIADALLPLGLPPGPGGPPGDRAAAVGRWLLWGGLRAQQTAVDGAIAACQEFTANPRTDARLGKVGH